MKRILLSEKIKKAPWFLTIEPYLRKQDHPIASHSEARHPRIVPLLVIDYGNLAARFKHMRDVGKYLLGSVRGMWKSAYSIRQNPYKGKKNIDPQTLFEVESFAKSLGVAEIGYSIVNPRYIFRDFRILFPNAMVFTIEMNRDKIREAPSLSSYIEIWRTYYEVGVIVNKVADFLRQRGYNAHAGPAVGGDVNYVPVAIDTGLGISGKNGLLITRQNGPRVRLAAVYTDIENLPFSQENQHQWVREYCESCNICVQKCPADAIFPVTKVHPDGGPTYIDHTKCAMPFSNDNGCTLCIKYCPFGNVSYDKLKTKFETKTSISAN
ncbi:MAG: [Fe-S]-binding protein [Chloroflexi bacterium HGW-Chloroflexi-4]|jgi:Pyruvate/2-oxoacid:ferredoxin oxidoreductase delta subunit|nr:MAG: [Fe-S]-binding protein [Chloroflexi bacterium HGW-Chloroflexi-4]